MFLCKDPDSDITKYLEGDKENQPPKTSCKDCGGVPDDIKDIKNE